MVRGILGERLAPRLSASTMLRFPPCRLTSETSLAIWKSDSVAPEDRRASCDSEGSQKGSAASTYRHRLHAFLKTSAVDVPRKPRGCTFAADAAFAAPRPCLRLLCPVALEDDVAELLLCAGEAKLPSSARKASSPSAFRTRASKARRSMRQTRKLRAMSFLVRSRIISRTRAFRASCSYSGKVKSMRTFRYHFCQHLC